MKILIAEDDKAIMTSYKLILESRRHEVFTASDGDECLKIFNAHYSKSSATTPFDVVILDYRIPNKDGIEVAEQILSMVPEQRIIIASAYIHELTLSKISDKSNHHYIGMLQKPFEFDDFLELVERRQLPAGRSNQNQPSSDSHIPFTGVRF